MNIRLLALTSFVCAASQAMDQAPKKVFLQRDAERQLSLAEALTFLKGRVRIQEDKLIFKHYQKEEASYTLELPQAWQELKLIGTLLKWQTREGTSKKETKPDRILKMRALTCLYKLSPKDAVTQFPVLDKLLLSPAANMLFDILEPCCYIPESMPKSPPQRPNIFKNRIKLLDAIREQNFQAIAQALEEAARNETEEDKTLPKPVNAILIELTK